MTSLLFSPLQLGPVELSNRLAVAPMCQYSGSDGSPTDWHIQHLGQLAYSGAGLVMVEATAIERRGRISHGDLGLYSDDNEQAMARVLRTCERLGGPTVFGVQLAHAGRKASCQAPWEGGKPLTKDAWEAVSSTANPFDNGWHVPVALDQAGIDEVIANYVQAARRAVSIGFKVLEVHCAHGYLIHQFLSPLANQRDDNYGGSLENRLRFGQQVIRAVRAAVPADVAVGIRISATDWVDEGWSIDDSIAFVSSVKDQIAYCCVSSGGSVPKAAIKVGPGFQVPFAKRIREATGVVTRAVGMIFSPQQAETILQNGEADQIALGRPFMDEPRWGWRAAEQLGAPMPHFPAPYHMVRSAGWLAFKSDIVGNS
ncbi:MAG: NADH:flavin oxidoreductase/NADH oxidase [Spongiibacteraceae bacterium]